MWMHDRGVNEYIQRIFTLYYMIELLSTMYYGYLHLMTGTMPRKKIHPRRNCGPCVLCGQNSYQYYAHPIRWSDSLRESFLALEDIDVSSCICWNCEKDIKKGIENPLYVPRWKKKEDICYK